MTGEKSAYNSNPDANVRPMSSSALDMLQQKRDWFHHNQWKTGMKDKNQGNVSSTVSRNSCVNTTELHTTSVCLSYLAPQLFLLRHENAMEDTSWLELDLGITEIAGEAGSGKTQICMGVCLSCVMLTYTYPTDLRSYTSDRRNHMSSTGRSQLTLDSTVLPDSKEKSMNPYKRKKIGPHHDGLSDAHANTTSQLLPASMEPRKPKLPYSAVKQPPTNPYIKNTPSNYNQHDTLDRLSGTPHSTSTILDHVMDPPRVTVSQSGLNTRRYYYRAIYASMGEGVTESQCAYRLNQMYQGRQNLSNSIYSTIQGTNLDHTQSILTRILFQSIRNEEDFHDWLYNSLPQLLSKCNSSRIPQYKTEENTRSNTLKEEELGRFGVIILDSMAGLFRIPDDSHNKVSYAKRSGLLFQAAAQLKKLSFDFGVHILVVNQVTVSDFNDGKNDSIVPTLGLSWSHCVNTRYMISRQEQNEQRDPSQNARTRFARQIQLHSSSRFPSVVGSFRIDTTGCILQLANERPIIDT